ncbi:hypothetical protein U9M48_031242 [Paspalum notatum var. saurae]|uniref:Uncharacterized protein n=1 Tax=Paspalum notatum var. saurae TaxID=547442 RepID=A0AAQ3X464_PASNO
MNPIISNTIQHSLVSCVFAREVWSLIFNSFGLLALASQPGCCRFVSWWYTATKAVSKKLRKCLAHHFGCLGYLEVSHNTQAMFDAAVASIVGNGGSILFWSDRWLNGRVRDIKGGLSVQVLVEYLLLWDQVDNVELQQNVPDLHRWKLTQSGTNSSKSAYDAFFFGSIRFKLPVQCLVEGGCGKRYRRICDRCSTLLSSSWPWRCENTGTPVFLREHNLTLRFFFRLCWMSVICDARLVLQSFSSCSLGRPSFLFQGREERELFCKINHSENIRFSLLSQKASINEIKVKDQRFPRPPRHPEGATRAAPPSPSPNHHLLRFPPTSPPLELAGRSLSGRKEGGGGLSLFLSASRSPTKLPFFLKVRRRLPSAGAVLGLPGLESGLGLPGSGGSGVNDAFLFRSAPGRSGCLGSGVAARHLRWPRGGLKLVASAFARWVGAGLGSGGASVGGCGFPCSGSAPWWSSSAVGQRHAADPRRWQSHQRARQRLSRLAWRGRTWLVWVLSSTCNTVVTTAGLCAEAPWQRPAATP